MLNKILLIFAMLLLVCTHSYADSITIDQILDKGEIRVGFVSDVPPYGILDLTRKGVNVGCEELAKKIQELKIKLSLFGHVHEAQGEIVKDKTLFINTACIVSSTIIEA